MVACCHIIIVSILSTACTLCSNISQHYTYICISFRTYRVDSTTREVSLTAPPPTNAAGRQLTADDSPVTEEDFYSTIDRELAKVESFTLQQVTELRMQIDQVESDIQGWTTSNNNNNSTSAANNTTSTSGSVTSNKTLQRQQQRQLNESQIESSRESADTIAKSFLILEKYVNINFMGFHKILKKHDKNSPQHQCKQFYINRMHNQAWVRGDYSDVVVRLSGIYAALRDDHVVERKDNAQQSFLRSTTKYWVRTEDVSKVKYAILKHLPVFLQKTSTGESDSQLTNSVYFDNDQLGEFSSLFFWIVYCIVLLLFGVGCMLVVVDEYMMCLYILIMHLLC